MSSRPPRVGAGGFLFSASFGAKRRAGWIAALALALSLGCASPTARVESRAAALGFERIVLDGGRFAHLAYLRGGPTSHTLHVYIENDGRPWRFGNQVNTDPTPRNTLMLEAMALDPGPALYLGRPCYFIAAADSECNALMWTHRRYAPEVVDSMARALRRFLRSHPFPSLSFIGHSGGGTLAVLLAEHFEQTRAVVTVAANLDVAAWARLHDYSPLDGSLDPMQRPPLPDGIMQWHLAGADDEQIPPALFRAYAARHPDIRLTIHEGQDHACCWRALWPEVLQSLGREVAGAPR